MCSRFPSPKFFVCLFLHIYIQLSQHYLLKSLYFSHWLALVCLFVCWKFVNSNGMVCFWLLNLFHWSIHPILSSMLDYLDYYPSSISLKSDGSTSICSISLKSDGQSFQNFYLTFMLSHLILWNENACPHSQMSKQGSDINELKSHK